MNYRQAVILAASDIGSAGTKVIDLNIPDVISRIEVIFRAKNGNSTWAAHPAKNISKIELVDGSDVLFSLSGQEAQSLNFYDRKISSDNHMTGSNGEFMRSNFGLDFGRQLYDRELALDPSKFTNLQLKITWDEDVANASATINDLTVLAHIFDQRVPTPKGFLMNKELVSYTPSAGANEYINMPTDHPYRKLMFGSLVAGQTFSQQVAEARLSEDNEKRIPFNLTGDQLFWEMKKLFPAFEENIYHVLTSSDTTFYVTPSEDAVITGVFTATLKDLVILFSNGGKAIGKAETASQTAYMTCKGYIPHGYVAMPFGDQIDLDDWYDVGSVGSLQLRLKAGPSLGSSPTTQVFSQQLRLY